MERLGMLMGVLFIGSIWGLLEATMGNILHWFGPHPGTGLIMTSLAIGFLTFGKKLYPKRWTSVVMGVIASGFKALDFFVPGSNVFHPMIAIMAIALTFEAAAYLTDKMKEIQVQKAVAGFAVGYVSIAAFAFIMAYIVHYYYWLNKGIGGIFKYLAIEGWQFAVGGMIMSLLGYNLITWLEKGTNVVNFVQTKAFNYVALSTSAVCATIIIIV